MVFFGLVDLALPLPLPSILSLFGPLLFQLLFVSEGAPFFKASAFNICHLPSAQVIWQKGQNGLISRKLLSWVLTSSSNSSPATSFTSPVRWHCLRLLNVGFHFETASFLHVLRLKKKSEPTAELWYTTVAVYVLCSLLLCQGFDTCKATTEDRASIAQCARWPKLFAWLSAFSLSGMKLFAPRGQTLSVHRLCQGTCFRTLTFGSTCLTMQCGGVKQIVATP